MKWRMPQPPKRVYNRYSQPIRVFLLETTAAAVAPRAREGL